MDKYSLIAVYNIGLAINKPKQSETEGKVILPLSFAQIQMFPYMQYRPIRFCSSRAFQYRQKKIIMSKNMPQWTGAHAGTTAQ